MSERIKSVQHILSQALEIEDTQERAGFLSQACGADSALLQEVQELIRAAEAAGGFLNEEHATRGALVERVPVDEALPAQVASLEATITETVGAHIGRYKLLQKIGEGGCGVVYMAEQETPVRRKVALKVIKQGMDTRSVIARFEAERQALALMDHPNIARVLDAGATETGRPFFVMELVRGLRITHYCDQNKLDTHQRLELFILVCQAVQHAHQKGIIHRDLKPSNILVTVNDGVAVPKVIDFGIAKATGGRLTDRTLFTAFEQFLGTPAYMSPEQAVMTSLDVDTRSDIYSLGVLLYELLTGKTPFDTKALLAIGLDEMRRTIREREPVRPSTRLSTMLEGELGTTARQRGVEAPKLVHLVRGDLDWIVMKCLEKDRARRYETANGLAVDIKRHLNSEPVLARPPSAAYRLQKVVERNRLAVVAGAAVALTLLGGTAVSIWQAIRVGHEHERVQCNVIRQYVANGTRLVNDGDFFGSLLWYSEALRLDAGDPSREAPHRMRIASVLRQSPRLVNVFSHGKMSYHCEFSPDGSKVVTASDDHTARVWDATTGERLLVLEHEGEVYDAAFSPDGLRIVTSSQDKTAKVWDSTTGKPLWCLKHGDTVWRARFSPNSQLVATACEDHTAQIWNAGTGERVGNPLQHEARLDQVAFSPDGRFLTTVLTETNLAFLWDVATGERRLRLVHNGNYSDVPFTSDSKRFLTCDNGDLHIWNADTLTEEACSPLKHPDGINGICFSPDGRKIMTACSDSKARVWDAVSGQLLFTPRVRHGTEVNLVRASPDGRRFITAGADGTAQFWSTQTDEPVSPPLKQIMYVKYIAINPDGRRVLANSCDQAARVWDLATAEISGPLRPFLENEQRSLSPDNQYGLLQEGTNVWITNAQSNQRLAVLPHTDPIVYASFSRDGHSVITACQENNPVSSKRNDIFLWQVPTGRPINTLQMSQSFLLMYASFSPDNRRVLTCGFDYTARLWDAHTGQPLSEPMRHRERVPWGAFSPDGQSVVTVSWDRTARVWDASNGTPLTPPLQHKAKVSGAFWSANGKRLTTVTEDDHLQVWDLATGEPLTIPQKIQDPSTSPTANLSASAQPPEDLPSDDRPVSDIVTLAQMLALARIDSGGNVVPLQLRELTSAWQLLRKKYPAQFAASSAEVTAWYRREAQESDAEGNLAAALFHLRLALKRQPDDGHLKQASAEVAARLLEQTNYPLYKASLHQRIPPRDSKAGTQQVNLAPYYNLALTDSLDQNGDGDNFASLPSGLQTFAGIRFDVRGVIHLEGLGAKRAGQIYPERVDGIQVGSKCSRLHFLHATAWGAAKDAVVGKYILHYEDGESHELPIVFGRDLTDWWFPNAGSDDEPGRPLAAWLGSNRTSANAHCPIALFESTRDNPRPGLELVSIDFVSSMSEAAPFLVGLSVE